MLGAWFDAKLVPLVNLTVLLLPKTCAIIGEDVALRVITGVPDVEFEIELVAGRYGNPPIWLLVKLVVTVNVALTVTMLPMRVYTASLAPITPVASLLVVTVQVPSS